MTLIITCPFATKREQHQGINRVGRFGDAGRYILKSGINMVDQKSNIRYLSKLYEFV